MSNDTKFYIDGQWVEPVTPRLFNVINPATEDVAGQISLGSAADIDRAVAAARARRLRLRGVSRGEGRTWISERVEHDPEKACPGLDPGWVPVFGKDHAPRKS